MREIKFRGKRLDNGEWLYGNLVELRNPFNPNDAPACFIMPKEVNIVAPDSIAGQDVVDPDTVGQFTGLLDKNGREIYDGDIVCANHFFVRHDVYTPKPIRNAYNIEIDQEGLVTSVLYSRNYAIEFHPNKGWIMRNGSDQHRMHSIKGKANIEVIGNIHDNPELLKP